MTNWDSENYWSKSGHSFNLDDDKSSKYKFDDISKFSTRNKSAHQQSSQVNEQKQTVSIASNPVSILSEPDLECSQLLCFSCNKLILQDDFVKYEGNKIFTNEICWKHWIKKMVENENFQIRDLSSYAAKKLFLEYICSTCNGQLIIKVILIYKGALGEFDFGSLLYDNNIAYHHYMSFLRETRQTDEKLLRCKNLIDEPMKNLRELINDNYNVNANQVGQFIRKLIEIRDEIKLNSSAAMSLQCEMINEYAILLGWQADNRPDLINDPFVKTCIEAKLSQKSIIDKNTTRLLQENFKMTPEEYFWTALKPILERGNFTDIDKALNYKGYSAKPDILYERIVSYLHSLDSKPDDLKMKCLLKISNANDQVMCAKSFNLLNPFIEYCQKNRETSALKKIQQVL